MSIKKNTPIEAKVDRGVNAKLNGDKGTIVSDFPKRTPAIRVLSLPKVPDTEVKELEVPATETKDIEVKELKAPEFDNPVFYNENLSVKQGRYHWRSTKENRSISNFIIEPLYHLADTQTPKRVFRVHNVQGQKVVLCVPTKELSTVGGFQSALESVGNFVPALNQFQYTALKEWWFANERKAVEVNTLGYFPGTNLYAFANGIFDGQKFQTVNEFGIVEVGANRYFIPAFSSVYNGSEGMFQHERRFVHDQNSRVSFMKWSNLFCRAFSENENGVIGVMFLCATIFRTAIATHTNFFPLLFLFGMKGTGKSTFRDAMLSLFGLPQDAVSLGGASTTKGFNRRLSQRRDAVIVFEEYKNGINDSLIEMLKNAYDLIGYERAEKSNDNRTNTTPVLSSVVVAGQELPTKETALFSRTITVEFSKTTFSDDHAAAYNELKDLHAGAGVTAVTLELLRCRPQIESGFVKSYREMCAWLKECKAPTDLPPEEAEKDTRLPHNVDDRSINNTAVLLAVYRIMEKLLPFPFTFWQLFDTLVSKLKTQVEIMNTTTEVNLFWDAIENLATQRKIIDGRDFRVKTVGAEKWLYIYLKAVFPAYAEYMKRTGGNAIDQSTLTQYLKRLPGFRPGKGRGDIQIKMSENTESRASAPKWCLAFELESTGVNIEN